MSLKRDVRERLPQLLAVGAIGLAWSVQISVRTDLQAEG
jgi:hypothetical protein